MLGVVVAVRERKPKRKVKPPDMGTPEQQAKRRALVGDANPQLASYPLGVLLARKLIDQDQHNAGLRYAQLCRVMLNVGPREPSLGYLPSDERDARTEREWRLCTSSLERAGQIAKWSVDTICVYEQVPIDADATRHGLTSLHRALHGLDRTPGKR
jgi:hypothetical protein